MLTLYSYFSSFPRYPRDFLRFSSDWNKKLDIARNRLSNSNVLGCNLGNMWKKSPRKYYKICLVSFASPAPFCVNLSCFQHFLFSTFPVLSQAYERTHSPAMAYFMPGLRKSTVFVYNGYRDIIKQVK